MDPFVQVGDQVKSGQTLGNCGVRMNLMNEIESEYTGRNQGSLVEMADGGI